MHRYLIFLYHVKELILAIKIAANDFSEKRKNPTPQEPET